MPWKHRGFWQNTLSALESCDSSSFPDEDPGDCLLSIHQRQWVGWAAAAARRPQHRAQAVTLRTQRLWSWIVLNRELLCLSEPCVPGESSHFRSAEKQCSKWLGYCSRHRFLGLIRSWSLAAFAGREAPSSPGAVSELHDFLLLLLLNPVRWSSRCAVTLAVSFCAVWMCVLQGSACCVVRHWTSAVRFVAFFSSHVWQCLNRDGAE